jgi:uncharacterized protein (DUF433 family)
MNRDDNLNAFATSDGCNRNRVNPAILQVRLGDFMDRFITEPGQRSNPHILGTQVTVRDVCRDWSLRGMTDDEVLQKYPELEPHDLAAVREFAAKSIESRTHDEFTGRPILPRDWLVHGRYYKGRCRNATIARWNADERCFFHWREKLGHIYIETIQYPTDEQELLWDVFDVVQELSNPRFEIPFGSNAVFTGNRDDLYEHAEEMWSKPPVPEEIKAMVRLLDDQN